MSKPTARYRFEFRMHDWARDLARRLAGRRVSLFIGLRADGTVRRVYAARPGESFDFERKAAMTEAHQSWLLYRPHEDPDAAYLEWLDLDQKVAEGWLGGSFGEQDFVDVRGHESKAGWPTSWRVITG